MYTMEDNVQINEIKARYLPREATLESVYKKVTGEARARTARIRIYYEAITTEMN